MEYLKIICNNVTDIITNWYYYWFGFPKSQQLLLEYVLMEDDFTLKCINTGDNDITTQEIKSSILKTNDMITKLVNDHNKSISEKKYTFLFEQNEN